MALRLLSLSPHYFYDRDIHAETERNRRSREILAETFVGPHLTPLARVLDYGCGPGYMARALAEFAHHVDTVDISRGVLECAKVLNERSNMTYMRPDELDVKPKADLAYSFAVAQHLSTDALVRMLRRLADQIRSGVILLLHFGVPGQQGWRTESDVEGASFAGRSGFSDIVIRPLRGTLSVPGDDDIANQHLLSARRS
ncbi:MAG: class I SAM-dependent methyltransferase [Streptosporangiaceae bacterium]